MTLEQIEKRKEYQREYSRQYRKNHPEKVKAAKGRWRENNPSRYLLRSCRARARAINLEFCLTESDIVVPTVCPVLGLVLSWDGHRDNSPSVDRIDSRLGYTPKNIIVVSQRANRIKNDATIEELEKIFNFYKMR